MIKQSDSAPGALVFVVYGNRGRTTEGRVLDGRTVRGRPARRAGVAIGIPAFVYQP